jgi:hypothetical protein
MTKFKWPCNRRDAHEAHDRECDSGCQPEWHKDWCAIYDHCPGVKAHPATQIGGNYISERKD